MSSIHAYTANAPHFSASECSEADQAMLEKFQVTTAQLMDVAGLRLAEFVSQRIDREAKVMVFAGKGHNGGDGIVAARYLKPEGYDVAICLVSTENELSPLTAKELTFAKTFDIPVYALSDLFEMGPNDLILDGILGCGLNGPPKPPYRDAITRINQSSATVIAIDIPSGMNATTGESYIPTVAANATLTFSVPKTGFLKNKVPELFVADIGIPKSIYSELSSLSSD